MKEPHRTASGAITESPLVLVDAFADEGLVGHGLLFTYTHLWPEISAQLLSSSPLAHGLEYADSHKEECFVSSRAPRTLSRRTMACR
jgi:mandelate racemase